MDDKTCPGVHWVVLEPPLPVDRAETHKGKMEGGREGGGKRRKRERMIVTLTISQW